MSEARVAQTAPKLLSESKLQCWETQEISSRRNAKTRSKQENTMPGLIIFKQQRIKDGEKMLKGEGEMAHTQDQS